MNNWCVLFFTSANKNKKKKETEKKEIICIRKFCILSNIFMLLIVYKKIHLERKQNP